jgi:hypothetical protein
MQIIIELSDNIADRLQPANVSRRVLELIAADHYLQGCIDAIREQTKSKVQQLINLTKTNQQAYCDILNWMQSRFEIDRLGQKLERFVTLSEDGFLAELRKCIPKKGKISDPLGVAGQKEVKEIYGDHALPMQTRNREILKLEH